MSEKKKQHISLSGHGAWYLSILCLFSCLLAQTPEKKREQHEQKSKVFLLHSDLLRKTTPDTPMHKW